MHGISAWPTIQALVLYIYATKTNYSETVIMLTDIQQCLDKSILIGLSYFDADNQLLEQKLLGGTVIKVDKENGLSILLSGQDEATSDKKNPAKRPEFILPTNLTCWFIAPQGTFHTSDHSKITNPDYLVTWDIYQTKKDKEDGEQQWWEWVPRTTPPQVGQR